MTRLRLDAALYHPAPKRQAKQMGRPSQVGKRLPILKVLIDNPYTPWHTVVLQNWYGHGEYTLQITSHTAVWYHTGLPAVPIRWVLVKDPLGKFQPQALLCTDTSAQPIQILHWFRYSLATRSHLPWKFERTWELNRERQWSSRAIARTTPALLALFSIVTVFTHQLLLLHPFELPKAAWYHKTLPTFADALALVRQQLWQMQTFLDIKHRRRHD